VIDPGKLRDRVTIQRASESRNARGETVLTWTDYTERWASVDGVSSREALAAGQSQVEMSHRVRLRYVNGLTQSMRIMWQGRKLEIVSLLEHGHRSEHELLCQETT
jgi:SPP1 family predicted phage head-tail adaptor